MSALQRLLLVDVNAKHRWKNSRCTHLLEPIQLSQLDHMRRLQRLLVVVVGCFTVRLVWWQVLVVLKLYRRTCLWIVRSVVLVR